MRIYFHPRRAHEVMLDREGVEVSGWQEARAQALRAVEELGQHDAACWSGWTLVCRNATGHVLFTLDLDTLVCTS